MTPGARVAAAIGVLDAVREGAPAERTLTNWARGARYAGSTDRAAVRDHVFAVLRRWRSCAARGGGSGGRALLIGLLRDQGIEPEMLFTGAGHAPPALSDAERAAGRAPDGAEARDLPDWLWPRFEAALGDGAARAAEVLRHRAPVTLRVNARRTTRAAARAALAREGIACHPLENFKMALQVTEGERKISASELYRGGAVELQDASSQAAMEALELPSGARVLDYCAGGGGKTLALAARLDGTWFAHDASVRRMSDLPARAVRAGVEVRTCKTSEVQALGPFDAVLCDVPCSGSGTWRRGPQAKWALTPDDLAGLRRVQADILARASVLVAPGGELFYCTCSILKEENECVIEQFLCRSDEWRVGASRRWPISETGDGFFLAQLKKE
ncbi:RsmB/NOP family class I SAM-dependent RNA methyltransferase [Roseovarius ramblicola]|uniref:RsmB/NOP family class I SAM-dependent RNA methyltransferase n=1 Tax=Roseovarius ramblicola TaxID=2022336 RepID=A0ABV5I137_9RHOB